jgi:hypothetical protein
MTEGTKEHPSPLDGYESAKPDEPIFTLQGGDPLASSLVRIWAYLARVRCGLRGDVSWISAPIMVAEMNSIAHDPNAVKELLTRATQAEMISWLMDGYRRGEESIEEQAARMDDLTRLDVYDIRRRTTTLISNFGSDLLENMERLRELNYGSKLVDAEVTEALTALRSIADDIEVRRGN